MTTNEPRVSREHILALAKKCGMVWGYTTTELVDAVIGFAYVVLNDKAVQEAFVLANPRPVLDTLTQEISAMKQHRVEMTHEALAYCKKQAQRIAELEFDNSNLKAVIDRLHLDYKELEAEVSANLQERVRMQAVINAFENGDRVSKYAPDTPEIAALREDAERYAFIRAGKVDIVEMRGWIAIGTGDSDWCAYSDAEFDVAIDAARGVK